MHRHERRLSYHNNCLVTVLELTGSASISIWLHHMYGGWWIETYLSEADPTVFRFGHGARDGRGRGRGPDLPVTRFSFNPRWCL